jgi:hypothetical protein
MALNQTPNLFPGVPPTPGKQPPPYFFTTFTTR